MNYENEEWRDIIIEKNGVVYDYTGLYQVSNLGRVRSLRKERMLKCKPGKRGYKLVVLYKDGKVKKFLVHRLVATAFIPNPENLPVVNHLDENPSNDVWTNLEWCTVKYNVNYGTCQERKSEKTKGQERSEETKRKISEAMKGDKHPMYGRTGDKNPKAKKVICLETKQIFGCVKEAQGWLGKGDIAHCLTGRSKTAGGLHWMYLEDYKRQLRKQSDINNSKQLAA